MGLERREAERAQACREPLSLLEHRRRVGRLGERRDREGRGQRRDRGRRLAAVQFVCRLARGERVSDPRARETEQFRERAQDDHTVVEQVDRRHAAVLEVRLVDDERSRVRQRPELAGRVVRAAREGRAPGRRLRSRRPRAAPRCERAGRSARPGRRSCRQAPRTPARRAGSGRRPPRRARRSPAARRRSPRSRRAARGSRPRGSR